MEQSEQTIQRFINDQSIRLEKGTLQRYVTSIRQLLHFCQKPIEEVTTPDIRRWLLAMEEKGYKLSSISQRLLSIRTFYRYLIDERLLTVNAAQPIPEPKREDKLPYYLTPEQLTALKQWEKWDLKQRAVIEVLASTGVRIGELANMKKTDIQWEERMITIPEGKGKKERVVLFTPTCREHLEAYLNTRDDDLPSLFLNRHKKRDLPAGTINRWFREVREALGFHVTPHTLRHTFAAHLAKKGMPLASLQVLLGHDHPRYTHLYARLYGQDQKDQYDDWM